MESQVKFNGFRRRLRRRPGGFGAEPEPGQFQQGSGEGSGEGLGGFGAESGQIPEKVWELWCRARSGSTRFGKRFRRRFQDSRKHWWKAKSSSMVSGEGYGEGREALVQSQSQVRFNRVPEKVPEKVWEALVQSQVRFNRVPEKVPEKVPGSLGAKQSQVQWVPEKVAEKVPEKVLGIFGAGSGQVQQVQQGFLHLASQHASERFVKIKLCGCWGYYRRLFLLNVFHPSRKIARGVPVATVPILLDELSWTQTAH